MRRLIWLALALPLVACEQQTVQRQPPTEIRTIDNAPVRSVPVENVPLLTEEATILRPQEIVSPSPVRRGSATPAPSPTTDARPQMPFAPLIAMDPVDGSKVSIRMETPTTEYKNRLYYFASEANQKAFIAQPETYVKGSLSKY